MAVRLGRVMMAAALLGAATPAAAEAWRLAAQNDNAVMLVDADSVQVRGSIIYATVMTVARPQQTGDWDQSIIRREIDCGRGQSAMMERRFFDRGRLVEQNTDRLAPDAHGPGSMMRGVLDTVCGRRDYLSTPVADPYRYGWGLINAAPASGK